MLWWGVEAHVAVLAAGIAAVVGGDHVLPLHLAVHVQHHDVPLQEGTR